MIIRALTVLTAAALTAAMPAAAATFIAESGFGAPPSFVQGKTAMTTGAFATGQVIGAADVSGFFFGFFTVDLDTTAKTLTLTGAQFGNYEYGYLSITGITGPAITSLTTVQSASLFDPNYYGSGFAADVPTPQLSFTGTSILIAFNSIGSTSGQFNYDQNGGQAVFSYATATAVPDAAVWALMIAGLTLTGVSLRRRRHLVSVAA